MKFVMSAKTDPNRDEAQPHCAENVEAAGFSKVEQTKYDLPLSDLMSPLFKVVRTFIKRHVMGVATK